MRRAARPITLAGPLSPSSLGIPVMSAHLPRTTVRRTRALQSLMIAALALAACQDFTAPPSIAPTGSPAASATKFWEASSSVAWNTTARELIALPAPNPAASPVAQTRVLTYLSVAQYNAVVRAEDTKARGVHASPSAAAASASLVVLKTLNVLGGSAVNFPAAGAMLDAKLAAERAAAVAAGKGEEFAMGEAVGRAVGAEVVTYASTDNANLTPPPANPGGAGKWTGTNSIRGLYGARTFALTSGDQFRPGPPPAITSQQFQDAFAQTRAEATSGSQANLDLAMLWASRGSAYLNGVATDLIVAHHRNEREAARILALANMATFDATNACFDAKFAYYLIRPTQYAALLGPAYAFNTLVPLPNHPSYPSGHSCQTASYATVLAAEFPDRETRDYLAQQVDDAGRSRMVGGLHYLFDCTVGQELGRNVANWVLGMAPVGHEEIPLD